MSGFRQVQSVDCAVLAMCSSVVILHSNAIVKQTNVVPLWTKQIPSLSLLPAWLYLFLQYLSSYLFTSYYNHSQEYHQHVVIVCLVNVDDEN